MGVPVAFAIGLTAAIILISPYGPPWVWENFSTRMYSQLNAFTLLAVPFFLFAGRIMNEIGVTDDLFNFSEELVGPLPGGIGHVNVIVSVIFSGMSGSAVADAAGLGTIEYKAMKDRGYDGEFAAGITGASATIGPIIPPSIPVIIYGVTAEVSIGALFIGGIIPGLLMAGSLMVFIYITRRGKDDSVKPFNPKKLVKSFIVAIPAFIAPIIIIGGIMFGVFTPTEAAVVASLYMVLIGVFYYQSLGYEGLVSVFQSTFKDTAIILSIIAFAAVYGFVLNISGVPRVLTELLLGITGNTTLLILLLVIVLIVLGTFMETIAIILITVPVLAPVLPEIGVSPIAFGIIMMIALMIGLITPPLGVILFVLERVTDLELMQIFRGVAPFYIPLLAVLLLLIFFPEIILYLPERSGLI